MGKLYAQLKDRKTNIYKDIVAGVVVALVSIPISMGYAQIAGLPVVYGLYGSLLPILCFGLLTTSPQFVVGVDAMPAVMVGTLLAQMGISAESDEAMQLVPVMSFFVAAWFLLFYFIKAGRIVKYISTPVMGGFISGVGMTIILMQIPKLFGGSAGTGEVVELLEHIISELDNFHLLSFALGFGTVVIILVCKKYIPKVPMTVIMLILGAVLQAVFGLDENGVKLLPEVSSGLPRFIIPNPIPFLDNIGNILIQSASISVVIMAQTLLATGNYAMKYGDKVDNNNELLVYGAMNFAGSIIGVCPINGSVSRSGIADSFGCRSQLMSITASFTMLLVLLFGTPLLHYLPVPVLTGIVMTALIGILDIPMAKRLWKCNRNEWIIFMVAFFGVLLFGTVNGVLIGVVLAFGEVAVRAVHPVSSFLGRIPGHGNFYSLDRNSSAKPINRTVIYRFSGNLFFANIDRFINEIEDSINDDTRLVIIDARGIGTVDITAVDRLVAFNKNMKVKGIKLYITEHDGSLNDQLRSFGGGELINDGAVRRTITLALRDAGLEKPYELLCNDGVILENEISDLSLEEDVKLSEFEWLFGREEATAKMEEMANEVADRLVEVGVVGSVFEKELLDGNGLHTDWGTIGLFDENAFIDFLELRLEELVEQGKISEAFAKDIEKHAENRRKIGERHLDKINPHAIELIKKHRDEVNEYIRLHHPERYEHFEKIRETLWGAK